MSAVARLAHKYEIRAVVGLCEQYMIENDADYTYQTVLTAQHCHMTELLQYCADILSRYQTVDEMVTCNEFTSFDDNTVLTLFGKRLERFENLFKQYTLYSFRGSDEYKIENWHTFI